MFHVKHVEEDIRCGAMFHVKHGCRIDAVMFDE